MIRYYLKDITQENLLFLADELRKGKIFIMPTGTIYGICCNAMNEKSVRKVYGIKGRNYKKPLIVLTPNKEILKTIAGPISKIENQLMNEFWPGGLTIVLKKKNLLPDIVTTGLGTVGVRIDDNHFVKKILALSKVPIVSTSANKTGKKNIKNICDLDNYTLNSIDYIIDVGDLNELKESTIVKVENDKIICLREGNIPFDEVEKIMSN